MYRSVGNTSTAIGFIILGMMMLLKKSNIEVFQHIMAFWPIILVMFGVELLIEGKRLKEGESIKWSRRFLLVVILAMIIDCYYFISDNIYIYTSHL